MEMGIIKVGGYMALSYQYGAGMGEAGDTPAGGTNLMEIPTKVEYAGKDSLTIYTTKSAARVGTEKALHMNLSLIHI